MCVWVDAAAAAPVRVEFITGTWDTPLVEFGLTSGNYSIRVTGTSTTYTAAMVRTRARRTSPGGEADAGSTATCLGRLGPDVRLPRQH